MAFRSLFVTGVALATITAPTRAQEQGEPIIITATKIATPLREIGSSVSLLTKTDLDRLGDAFAVDALRTLPGVAVSQNGGPGGLASIRIRGEEAYRTLVLIDGIRVSDAAAPQVASNLTSALSADIGRIEVVRGTQSLLYGADAVGGVVQILTPDPALGLGFAGAAQGGAYQTKSGSAALLYGGTGWGGTLQTSYYKSGGFSAKEGDPALDDPDGLEAYAIHGKMAVELGANFRLEGVGRTASSSAEFDGSSAFPPFSPADPNRLLKSRETAGRLGLVNIAADGRVRTELAYIYSASRRSDLANGLPFAFGSKFDGTRRRIELQSTIALSPSQSVLVGGDQEALTAQTDAFKGHTSEYGVYGEWQAGFGGQLFTTLGARFDHGREFSDHVSGRASAAYLFTVIGGEDSRLHTSIGTGFREPSLFEQATNQAAALPAPHEEKSRGLDFGVSQSLWSRAIELDVTYFDQTIANEIRFDNVGFSGYFQSAGRSRSKGVEVALHAERRVHLGWLTAVRLDAAYTYTDARVHSPDPENGLARVRRPRHISSTNLTVVFGDDRAELTLAERAAEDTQDGFREFRTRLDDYGAMDLVARYRFSPSAEMFVKGVNLTDEQYEEVAGFATSDAAVYAGFRVSW
jgi:vitamin B12 transporter